MSVTEAYGLAWLTLIVGYVLGLAIIPVADYWHVRSQRRRQRVLRNDLARRLPRARIYQLSKPTNQATINQ